MAHTLLFGATGAGKSFCLAATLQAAQKYEPLTFIFDLGGSYETLTRVFGGTYLNVGMKNPGFTINPFSLEPTDENRNFLFLFLRVLIESGDRYELFTSPATGRHFHTAPVQQDYIRPAGCCLVECPKCGAGEGVWCLTDSPTPNGKRLPLHEERWAAAGKFSSVGWHTFRHTYRSWLDDTGAPMGCSKS